MGCRLPLIGSAPCLPKGRRIQTHKILNSIRELRLAGRAPVDPAGCSRGVHRGRAALGRRRAKPEWMSSSSDAVDEGDTLSPDPVPHRFGGESMTGPRIAERFIRHLSVLVITVLAVSPALADSHEKPAAWDQKRVTALAQELYEKVDAL